MARRSTRRDVTPIEAARRKVFWPFVAPAVVLYTVVFIAPSLYNVYLSFQSWSGWGYEQEPVGWANYRRLLHDSMFLQSFRNTLVLMVAGTALIMLVTFGSMFALRTMRGSKIIRSVIFFPQIIAPVAIGTALGLVLDPNGVLNKALRMVGLDSLARPWLAPSTVFQCIVLGLVWSMSGLFVALMMSAVDNIPEYLYEECRLAGASKFQQFWHVTLPLTRDMAAVVIVMCVIQMMKVFDFIYTLIGGKGSAPTPEARTLAIQQYVAIAPTNGIPQLGYGAAMGVVFVITVAALMTITRRLTRHDIIEMG